MLNFRVLKLHLVGGAKQTLRGADATWQCACIRPRSLIGCEPPLVLLLFHMLYYSSAYLILLTAMLIRITSILYYLTVHMDKLIGRSADPLDNPVS